MAVKMFQTMEEFWSRESAGIGALPIGDFRLPIFGHNRAQERFTGW